MAHHLVCRPALIHFAQLVPNELRRCEKPACRVLSSNPDRPIGVSMVYLSHITLWPVRIARVRNASVNAVWGSGDVGACVKIDSEEISRTYNASQSDI